MLAKIDVVFEKKVHKSDRAREIGAQMLVDAGIDLFAKKVGITYELKDKIRSKVAIECELSRSLALTYVKENMEKMIAMAQTLKNG